MVSENENVMMPASMSNQYSLSLGEAESFTYTVAPSPSDNSFSSTGFPFMSLMRY